MGGNAGHRDTLTCTIWSRDRLPYGVRGRRETDTYRRVDRLAYPLSKPNIVLAIYADACGQLLCSITVHPTRCNACSHENEWFGHRCGPPYPQVQYSFLVLVSQHFHFLSLLNTSPPGYNRRDPWFKPAFLACS